MPDFELCVWGEVVGGGKVANDPLEGEEVTLLDNGRAGWDAELLERPCRYELKLSTRVLGGCRK